MESDLLRLSPHHFPNGLPDWWNPDWTNLTVFRDAYGTIRVSASRLVEDRAPFEGGYLIPHADRALADERAILAALADLLPPAS